MKQLFKQAMATLGLLSLILVVIFSTIATISGDSGTLRTLIMGGELRLKSGARLTTVGTSYIDFGDSSYIKKGAKVADTSAFSGSLYTKAIYIPGATPTDIFYVSKRVLPGVSTAYQADSCILGYMVKTDSLIVFRNIIGVTPVSGSKFSWFRVTQ